MNENFGVTVAWQGSTIEALTSIALKAEELGFGYFWIPEAWGLEAFSAAGHILGRTKKIRVGTGVVNVFSRSASLIGMSCATLEQIAPGRFLLGLGTSGRGLVESFHGVKFERPLERTREYVSVIRNVVSGSVVEHNGKILKLSRFRLYTRPVESLRIYIGAIGDANIRLAGEISDGAILTMYPISKLSRALNLLNGKALFAYLPTAIHTNDATAVKEIVKYIGFYIVSMGKYYASNLQRLGFSEEVKHVVEGSGVSESLIDELSLVGSQSEILEKVAKLPKKMFPVFAMSAKSSEEAKKSIKVLENIAFS